ncbi:MAG: protein translocase subunit SecD, partial [Caulobacteraceae bacterium]|nr:protein translocase subunit SecD [Caulobacter sp.]
MLQLRAWKVALVVAAALFGLLFALPNALPGAHLPPPFNQRLNLGLDLQGGSSLLYEVDTGALLKEQLGNYVESARTTLGADNIAFTDLGVVDDQVSVRITDPAKLDAAAKALGDLAQPATPGAARDLDLVRGPDQHLILKPAANWAAVNGTRAVERTIEVVRKRIDALGTREPSIIRQGTNRILIEAAGESDPEKLKAVVGKTAKLSFQMVSDLPITSVVAGVPPPGTQVVASANGDGPPLLINTRTLVSGEDLIDSQPTFDQNGRPAVSFRFNNRGAQRFGEASSQNIGKRFAIILDGRYISAPTIEGAIYGGNGQITGSFTQDQANQLALLLRSGALPAPLNVLDQRQVGAELGADAVRAGTISLGIGAAAIIAFIILAYGLFGVFAAVALIVNVLLIVAMLSITQ